MDHAILDAQRIWDRFGEQDPLWAILSAPDKQGRQWRLDEFMANGEREIALLMHRLAELGVAPARGSALDFGCGVGRTAQALARRFQHVEGLDVSPRMIDLAMRLNAYKHLTYRVNGSVRIALPDDAFDLAYCNIVLQHIPPVQSKVYLAEFLRVLRVGGLAVFQLPSHPPADNEHEIRPMPSEAYRACVRPMQPPPLGLPAGGTATLRLAVRNLSSVDWRQADCGSIRVGNHWLSGDGARMVVQDDGRASLPQVVVADDECSVTLDITAPAEPGRYRLEIDVVHEGVSWFAARTAVPYTQTIDIVAAAPGAAGAETRRAIEELDVPDYSRHEQLFAPVEGAADPDTAFPMHGIPQHDVVALIRASGGQVIHIDEDRRARPEWVGYVYYAIKRAGRPTA